jgi:uncharacterized membrane protein YphA (DoxX/SURF4 family)
MLVFRIILTAAFVVLGGTKLVQAKPLKDQFKEFGLPGFFLTLIGVFEIIGAIGLQFDQLSATSAAGLLLLVMLALYNHYRVNHPFKKFVPAIVLGSGLTVFLVLWLNLNPF